MMRAQMLPGRGMDQLSINLGKNIRAMRRELGFSQDTFALACGLDRSYMGRIERGEVNITVQKLFVIAQILQCEPAKLLPKAP